MFAAAQNIIDEEDRISAARYYVSGDFLPPGTTPVWANPTFCSFLPLDNVYLDALPCVLGTIVAEELARAR